MKSLLAAVAGMIVLVGWGMVFWGFLADPLDVFHQLPNAPAVTSALVNSDTASGTYFMPWPRSTHEQFERFVAQHKSGPFFRLSYVREGVDPNSPRKILLGCAHYLVVSLLAVALLGVTGIPSFNRRVAVLFLSGLMGTVFITLGDPIWFHMPWDYTRGVLVYEVVSWFLLSVTIGKLVRPPDRLHIRREY